MVRDLALDRTATRLLPGTGSGFRSLTTRLSRWYPVSDASQTSEGTMDESQTSVAMAFAKEFSSSALKNGAAVAGVVGEYVQRGPEGVGWLSFMGGAASIVLGCLGFLNIAAIILDPLEYVVNGYQTLFGVVVCLLEAPDEWIGNNDKLSKARGFIKEYARFLYTCGGRGLFYLFQGTLSMSLDTYTLTFLLGCYMCGMGMVNIAMQYGFFQDPAAQRRNADVYIHVT
ncbi:hypothetical protein AK812_SmicGene12935 [Symbiodinium microadriaticum]|uniref:Uncharacterized protein n=1 Tax=Symbiodinium microadriaticum TaxID=2951 RepID=A0A1Q9E9D6_SYMMI|nr:hypothetical protein AK812_SmicGene12935 [Symbiodinium microadriaticum]